MVVKKKWWKKYPERLKEEIKIMKSETNAVMGKMDGQIFFYETIGNLFGSSYDIIMICQDNHPFDPPKAYVLKPKMNPNIECHMYPDGHLDLAGSCDLDRKLTVLDIRNRAYIWIGSREIYQGTGQWI